MPTVSWTVLFHDEFDREYRTLAKGLQDELLACIWPRWQRWLHERKNDMPRNLEQVLAKLPSKRRAKVQQRAAELATLKDLRHAVEQTQEELATALGVGQDTISRLEQRSDMLLSTLKRYVEAMGGKLDLVAKFPNRPPVIIEQIAERRGQEKQSAKGARTGKRHAVEVV
jgi:transcriptional regulator with XRE-family HTH domain